MKSRQVLWGGIGVAGAAGVLGGAWMLSLPAARDFTPPPIGQAETDALLAALKPPKRQRPRAKTRSCNTRLSAIFWPIVPLPGRHDTINWLRVL